MTKDSLKRPERLDTAASRSPHAGQSLSASSPLSPGQDSSDTGTPPSPGPRTTSSRLKLSRTSRLKDLAFRTRGEIRKHIRDDWEWPPKNAEESVWKNGERPCDDLHDPEENTNQPGVPRNAWISRVNDDTLFLERDPGSEPDSDFEEDKRLTREKAKGVAAPDFKYESPDSVQETTDSEVSLRWRRLESRRHLYVEELRINDGLRNFEARRNAWTGAILAPRLSDQKSYIRDRNLRFKHMDPAGSSANAPYEYPTRGLLKQRVMEAKATERLETDNSIETSETDATGEDSAATSNDAAEKAVSGTDPDTLLQDESLIPYIPLAEPLIDPDNEIRRQIAEGAYESIYSKVVVQGITPSIPINLKDMTRILVAGWKADDEWPPKASILDPLVGRRRGRGGAQGEKGKEGSWLKKVLRIRGGGSSQASNAAVDLLSGSQD